MTAPKPATPLKPTPVDVALKLFGDVRAGEGFGVVLMLLNIFIILVAYYLIKTIREPLILVTAVDGKASLFKGPEGKAYAAAAQALVLIGFVPLYGWFMSRVSRRKLIIGVPLFFMACLELFYLGALAQVPFLGFVFYVWVGIFSLAIIAQFWSYANDLYTREAGDRLFAIIGIGMSVGAPVGSYAAVLLIERAKMSLYSMLQISAGLLGLHMLLLLAVEHLPSSRAPNPERTARAKVSRAEVVNGFKMVFQHRYFRLIALLLILLNLVNTTGEYILSEAVTEAAKAAVAADPSLDMGAFIGAFYGRFFSVVNIATIAIQALVVSRLVKWFGIRGVLYALPIVAFGVYGLIAAGVGFTATRWAKTAENSTDYSVMNTARAMLWLPTTREQKYVAKQTVDTFFVRLGDLASAGLVAVGLHWLSFGPRSFAVVNLVIISCWVGVAFWVYREYRRLAMAHALEAHPEGDVGSLQPPK